MAINRIYIRCKGCGNALFLGKTFGSGYYWENYYGKGVHLEDRLNEFFDKHNYCHNPKTGTTEYDERLFPLREGFDGCDGAFDIVYEGSDGTGIIDTVDEGVKDDNLAVLFYDRINECIEEIGKLIPKIREALKRCIQDVQEMPEEEFLRRIEGMDEEQKRIAWTMRGRRG